MHEGLASKNPPACAAMRDQRASCRSNRSERTLREYENLCHVT
ncbi:hypothetical protein HMPREF0321_2810 [Dermacoccus sp. Ellin185]|nr:hypothetical protein HMPREF0321_2810 [Dermacoccus sp. Ellin185]